MGKLKQQLIDTEDEQLDLPSPDYEIGAEDDQDTMPYDFWDNDEEVLKRVEEE